MRCHWSPWVGLVFVQQLLPLLLHLAILTDRQLPTRKNGPSPKGSIWREGPHEWLIVLHATGGVDEHHIEVVSCTGVKLYGALHQTHIYFTRQFRFQGHGPHNLPSKNFHTVHTLKKQKYSKWTPSWFVRSPLEFSPTTSLAAWLGPRPLRQSKRRLSRSQTAGACPPQKQRYNNRKNIYEVAAASKKERAVTYK